MTESLIPYRQACKNAALSDLAFQSFRSQDAYFNAVECGQGGELASYLQKHATVQTLSLIPQFRKLDQYGSPIKNTIAGFGLFSGTTLRYIVFADLMSRLFDLPENYTVVEIGAGFGGQAYILSQIRPFSKYYIYDLPEVEMLIAKMASILSLENLVCLDTQEKIAEDEIDLFISNYALSECDRKTQIDYFKRALVKAKRGFMLFNDTNIFDHLTLSDWIALFYEYGIQPKLHPEPVFTYTGNVLITWDRTK